MVHNIVEMTSYYHQVWLVKKSSYQDLLKVVLYFAEKTLQKLKVTPPKKSSCLYVCQHCLVHLGDIGKNMLILIFT